MQLLKQSAVKLGCTCIYLILLWKVIKGRKYSYEKNRKNSETDFINVGFVVVDLLFANSKFRLFSRRYERSDTHL